jgi:hypothetical protein
MVENESPPMGVVIVTYGSDDVIAGCLKALAVCDYPALRIVVSDNGSLDNSREVVREFAKTRGMDFAEVTPAQYREMDRLRAPALTLVASGENRGFAGGVNAGLDYLMRDVSVNQFWILNPDCEPLPGAATAYARVAAANPGFGMIGGRTIYHDQGGLIQSDGGRVNLWTGVCSNVNFANTLDQARMPAAEEIDYLSGANFVVSRAFIENVGLMCEDYFLYYEEVDWALRRGGMAIILTEDAIVQHHAGTSIGSGTKTRPHTPFSNYFNFRSRMIFVRRFRPWALPVAYVFSTLKIVQFMIKAGMPEAMGAFRGLNGLAPPRSVTARLDDSARAFLFGASGAGDAAAPENHKLAS